MRKLLLYIFAGLIFCSIGNTNDITDYEINGVSIGQSLLEYLSEDEIFTEIERIGNIDSSIVLRELKYEHGDLYSKSKIDKTSKHLREIGIFSTAIELYLCFFINLKILYKFFAASFKLPFLDKK